MPSVEKRCGGERSSACGCRPEMALPAEGCYHGLDKTHGGRPVLLTVREGAIAWRGEATEQEPVELAFLGRG